MEAGAGLQISVSGKVVIVLNNHTLTDDDAFSSMDAFVRTDLEVLDMELADIEQYAAHAKDVAAKARTIIGDLLGTR